MEKTYTKKFERVKIYVEDLIHIGVHNVNREIRLIFECSSTFYKKQLQNCLFFFLVKT